VTRPAGLTPKGLPFPGSIDIHARTPAALQALAEAIEAKLTALAPGLMLDTWRGLLPLTISGGVYGMFTVPFPRLAAVTAWIGTPGTDAGGSLSVGFIVPTTGSGVGYFLPSPTGNLTVAPVPSTLTVHAVGWGPPR
jgi:hypothetical protein